MSAGDEVAFTTALGETVRGRFVGRQDRYTVRVEAGGRTWLVAETACWRVQPEPAQEEVRIAHEAKEVLIGLAIIAVLVLVAGVTWTLLHP